MVDRCIRIGAHELADADSKIRRSQLGAMRERVEQAEIVVPIDPNEVEVFSAKLNFLGPIGVCVGLPCGHAFVADEISIPRHRGVEAWRQQWTLAGSWNAAVALRGACCACDVIR